MEGFKALCPEPTPPGKLTKEGYVPDIKDEGYRHHFGSYSKRRMAYIVVNSLLPSEIEWDTVVLDDPSTWANWEEDLKTQRSGSDGVQPGAVSGLGGQLPR